MTGLIFYTLVVFSFPAIACRVIPTPDFNRTDSANLVFVRKLQVSKICPRKFNFKSRTHPKSLDYYFGMKKAQAPGKVLKLTLEARSYPFMFYPPFDT